MKGIVIQLLLLALVFAGCNNKPNTKSEIDIQSDSIKIPEQNYLSGKQLQNQVDAEIRGILELANDERIADAIEIIALTEKAVKDILDSSYTDAISNIEDAVGKATIMITTRPDLKLFPLDVQVTTRDLVADMDVLKGIRKEADDLTDKGYLQAARHLLKNLASEIEIKTPMLPIATFPDALSLAVKELNDGKHEEALIVLNTALSTVFLETKYVPLPLIRAERILTEVTTLLEKGDNDKDINTLLDNADYQIRFAEALGYGKRDKEFKELYSAINEIREELKETGDGGAEGLSENLKKKLSVFKERISKMEKEVSQGTGGDRKE
ncbi:MAG: YfdX family protein [Draconibacterium sp.]|nr:YfdX family protein [Draconibacterium sp.]